MWKRWRIEPRKIEMLSLLWFKTKIVGSKMIMATSYLVKIRVIKRLKSLQFLRVILVNSNKTMLLNNTTLLREANTRRETQTKQLIHRLWIPKADWTTTLQLSWLGNPLRTTWTLISSRFTQTSRLPTSLLYSRRRREPIIRKKV